MNGAASASPTSPSASGSRDTSYICQATTSPWTWAPIAMVRMLMTNHRKFGIRSGAYGSCGLSGAGAGDASDIGPSSSVKVALTPEEAPGDPGKELSASDRHQAQAV